jgi:hypothetical protein
VNNCAHSIFQCHRYAEDMTIEFRKWMKWYGKVYSKFQVGINHYGRVYYSRPQKPSSPILVAYNILSQHNIISILE